MKYLPVESVWILVPKRRALNIERIAFCLWPTVAKFVLLLYASKCVEMAQMALINILKQDEI
jgi:hypothetical protein